MNETTCGNCKGNPAGFCMACGESEHASKKNPFGYIPPGPSRDNDKAMIPQSMGQVAPARLPYPDTITGYVPNYDKLRAQNENPREHFIPTVQGSLSGTRDDPRLAKERAAWHYSQMARLAEQLPLTGRKYAEGLKPPSKLEQDALRMAAERSREIADAKEKMQRMVEDAMRDQLLYGTGIYPLEINQPDVWGKSALTGMQVAQKHLDALMSDQGASFHVEHVPVVRSLENAWDWKASSFGGFDVFLPDQEREGKHLVYFKVPREDLAEAIVLFLRGEVEESEKARDELRVQLREERKRER